MRTFAENSKTRQDLAGMLEKQIKEKTFGRVRPLEVKMGTDKITIHGNCPSYHVKQLAIQALLELAPEAAPFHFALDIRVT
jgi:hypothetical protein